MADTGLLNTPCKGDDDRKSIFTPAGNVVVDDDDDDDDDKDDDDDVAPPDGECASVDDKRGEVVALARESPVVIFPLSPSNVAVIVVVVVVVSADTGTSVDCSRAGVLSGA